MIKKRPPNRLPYVKADIPANKAEAVVNTFNALSASSPTNLQINAKSLGSIESAAAYSDYFKNATSSPHLVSLRTSWKNRKNP